ncbi:MAG: phosphate/phosphite/phosphonate ABC transporter substrate-binding protein [Sedimenticola sp.]|nr:phosphate/phosphite/phosphonate ABC transporter substrate-binding protein [Sedimenticola sp.]
MRRACIRAVLLWLSWVTAAAAVQESGHLRFGVLPLQSPTKLAGMFLPLSGYLGEALGRPVQFVTSSSFSSFMEKVAHRQYDIIYLNPMLYGRSRPYGYRVIAKVASEPFTGILVVRRDGRLRSLGAENLPADLRIGFPDPGAFAATVMVRKYLQSLGIDVERQMQMQYFGSQDSAILALYNGLVDVTGTWRPSLRSMPPLIRDQLEIIAETPPQPQMPIAVRDDLPPQQIERLRQALVGLAAAPGGQSIIRQLGFKRGFEAASDDEYLEVSE